VRTEAQRKGIILPEKFPIEFQMVLPIFVMNVSLFCGEVRIYEVALITEATC